MKGLCIRARARGVGELPAALSRGRVRATLFLVLVLSMLAGTRLAYPANRTAQGEVLARSTDCFSCHALDHKVVGPSFEEIARRYRNQAGVEAKLEAKIKDGGLGDWGDVPMTPHPALSDEQLAAIVRWVLSLKGRPGTQSAAAPEAYPYTLPDGSQVKLDFPLFAQGHDVTADVFAGWEQFNSYCFRCHGEDASGSAYAPDLRQSLRAGMTRDEFIALAMAGNPAKGMPSWAGFFTPEEMIRIYEYVKGRSLRLIPAGRPATTAG